MTPRQVGIYRLDSLLGVGGMGEVYKAYDTQRDRYVALKLLPEAFTGDVEYVKRFQRESNVAARLREPHVIPIHDFGEIDGQLFIDMRLVDGAGQVATVTVLNAANNAIVTEIEVGETPHSEAVSPNGSRLAVTSYDGNKVFLINTATDKEIATIPVGKEPLDIAYSPDGRYLCTVNNDDSTVTVIDTADNRVIAELPAGNDPTSIAVLPNGRQAYVTDDGSATIEILNFAQ